MWPLANFSPLLGSSPFHSHVFATLPSFVSSPLRAPTPPALFVVLATRVATNPSSLSPHPGHSTAGQRAQQILGRSLALAPGLWSRSGKRMSRLPSSLGSHPAAALKFRPRQEQCPQHHRLRTRKVPWTKINPGLRLVPPRPRLVGRRRRNRRTRPRRSNHLLRSNEKTAQTLRAGFFDPQNLGWSQLKGRRPRRTASTAESSSNKIIGIHDGI